MTKVNEKWSTIKFDVFALSFIFFVAMSETNVINISGARIKLVACALAYAREITRIKLRGLQMSHSNENLTYHWTIPIQYLTVWYHSCLDIHWKQHEFHHCQREMCEIQFFLVDWFLEYISTIKLGSIIYKRDWNTLIKRCHWYMVISTFWVQNS